MNKGILGPDGNPIIPHLDDETLARILKGLSLRLDTANGQLVQLGFLVEFMYESLDKAGVKIDLDSYPEWAKKRYKEVREEAERAMKENNEAIEELKKNMASPDLKDLDILDDDEELEQPDLNLAEDLPVVEEEVDTTPDPSVDPDKES